MIASEESICDKLLQVSVFGATYDEIINAYIRALLVRVAV